MADAFVAQSGKDITIELGVVGESDASRTYLEDPQSAADVFMFANDQLKDLVTAGALYEVSAGYKDQVIASNVESSVDSATLDGKLYAFPMTADNGYFLYYDKSVFSGDDVKSLDKMLSVANAAGKKIFMDVSNGWYIASFFLGAGCTLSLDGSGNQLCDFNNAKGLSAAEAIRAFTADSSFVTGDDSVLQGGMGNSIAAGVSGTWLAESIQDKLGDNYAATKLPTFSAGGSEIQMASFGGYKLVGVNALTKEPTHAMDLANWLTNGDNQTKRFETRGLGPSNENAGSSSAVQANVALAALAAQSAYAFPQNDVLGNYWTPAEAFGLALENKEGGDLQAKLDTMVDQIQAPPVG
jgi:arabinogalactan oligomer/maltooligosaccharide transport system substrate-binding protein